MQHESKWGDHSLKPFGEDFVFLSGHRCFKETWFRDAVGSGFKGPHLICFSGSKSTCYMVMKRGPSMLGCREVGDLLHPWPARVKSDIKSSLRASSLAWKPLWYSWCWQSPCSTGRAEQHALWGGISCKNTSLHHWEVSLGMRNGCQLSSSPGFVREGFSG